MYTFIYTYKLQLIFNNSLHKYSEKSRNFDWIHFTIFKSLFKWSLLRNKRQKIWIFEIFLQSNRFYWDIRSLFVTLQSVIRPDVRSQIIITCPFSLVFGKRSGFSAPTQKQGNYVNEENRSLSPKSKSKNEKLYNS